MLQQLKSYLGELERLVIPVECPGCGLRDVAVCPHCVQWLQGPLRRVETQVPRLDALDGKPLLPVWALGPYTGPARGMVVAWKDKGREDLTRLYSHAATSALRQHRASNLFPRVDVVVPMPSSAASVRHRGRDHLSPVSTAVSTALQVPTWRALHKVSHRDQVGLSARARGQADIRVRKSVLPRAGLMPTLRPNKLEPGLRILLFDDVITTGATLAAARDALTAQGCDVVGAIVLAATPPRSTANSH
jgi:predicted amidophosphoribosyltransferase